VTSEQGNQLPIKRIPVPDKCGADQRPHREDEATWEMASPSIEGFKKLDMRRKVTRFNVLRDQLTDEAALDIK
jgi:hypothetical protein